MGMGERIQRAWRAWVRSNISAEAFRHEIASIEWPDAGDSGLYPDVVIGQRDGGPTIERVDGPMASDYFQGAGWSKVVAAIPVHEGMTKRDLIDFDVAEYSAYWDHPAWGRD